MPSGSVKWFNPTGGLDLIQPDDGYTGVFVEFAFERSLLKGLRQGQKADLERTQNRKVASRTLRPGFPTCGAAAGLGARQER